MFVYFVCLFSTLQGKPSTLPLLAWQFVIIQISESDRVIDPVLAFARDNTIYFYQVSNYLYLLSLD